MELNTTDVCSLLFMVLSLTRSLSFSVHCVLIRQISSILCPSWQPLYLVWMRRMIVPSWCPSTPRLVLLQIRYLSPSSQATSVRDLYYSHSFNELMKEIIVPCVSLSSPQPVYREYCCRSLLLQVMFFTHCKKMTSTSNDLFALICMCLL